MNQKGFEKKSIVWSWSLWSYIVELHAGLSSLCRPLLQPTVVLFPRLGEILIWLNVTFFLNQWRFLASYNYLQVATPAPPSTPALPAATPDKAGCRNRLRHSIHENAWWPQPLDPLRRQIKMLICFAWLWPKLRSCRVRWTSCRAALRLRLQPLPLRPEDPQRVSQLLLRLAPPKKKVMAMTVMMIRLGRKNPSEHPMG